MENVVYEIVKLKQEIQIHEGLAPMKARSTYSVARWLQNEIGDDSQENLVVLCFDTKANLTCFSTVFRGTLNNSHAHPREIFQRAILSSSARIIVAHNHPSNDPQPSYSDNQFTDKIKKNGELLGIPLLDHIIVGRDNYFLL